MFHYTAYPESETQKSNTTNFSQCFRKLIPPNHPISTSISQLSFSQRTPGQYCKVAMGSSYYFEKSVKAFCSFKNLGKVFVQLKYSILSLQTAAAIPPTCQSYIYANKRFNHFPSSQAPLTLRTL